MTNARREGCDGSADIHKSTALTTTGPEEESDARACAQGGARAREPDERIPARLRLELVRHALATVATACVSDAAEAAGVTLEQILEPSKVPAIYAARCDAAVRLRRKGFTIEEIATALRTTHSPAWGMLRGYRVSEDPDAVAPLPTAGPVKVQIDGPELVRQVERRWHLPAGALVGRGRDAATSAARKAAVGILREAGWTTTAIGTLLAREHSTVLYLAGERRPRR